MKIIYPYRYQCCGCLLYTQKLDRYPRQKTGHSKMYVLRSLQESENLPKLDIGNNFLYPILTILFPFKHNSNFPTYFLCCIIQQSFFSSEKFLLCSPCWPRTQFVAQSGFELAKTHLPLPTNLCN